MLNQNFNSLNKKIDLLNEKFDAKFDEIDTRFNVIDSKFDEIDSKFDAKFDEIDTRFNVIDSKFDEIDSKFDLLNEKFDAKFDVIDNNIKILMNDMKEIKSYIKTESLYFEHNTNTSLLNYLMDTSKLLHYYIPSNFQFPKTLYTINNSGKQKTLTDLDGVIIGTTLIPSKNNYLNSSNLTLFKSKLKENILINKYELHIIESKHSLSIGKIKMKMKQMIIFIKKCELKNNLELNILNNFNRDNVYLYFASPIIDKKCYDFILKKNYLQSNYWKNSNGELTVDLSEVAFFDNKIRFITYNDIGCKIVNFNV